MKKPTLAWAIKDENGAYRANTLWTKKDAESLNRFHLGKIIRVDIKEIVRKK